MRKTVGFLFLVVWATHRPLQVIAETSRGTFFHESGRLWIASSRSMARLRNRWVEIPLRFVPDPMRDAEQAWRDLSETRMVFMAVSSPTRRRGSQAILELCTWEMVWWRSFQASVSPDEPELGVVVRIGSDFHKLLWAS